MYYWTINVLFNFLIFDLLFLFIVVKTPWYLFVCFCSCYLKWESSRRHNKLNVPFIVFLSRYMFCYNLLSIYDTIKGTFRSCTATTHACLLMISERRENLVSRKQINMTQQFSMFSTGTWKSMNVFLTTVNIRTNLIYIL
jgi:hypothetical protein